MPKSKMQSITLSLAACIFLVTTATAAETQRLSAQFTDDVAEIRVSTNTEHKFVTATISSLQKSKAKKFALRASDSNAECDLTKSAFLIEISDDIAEINATPDLPYNELVSLISQLKDVGVAKFKFTAPKRSDGIAVPQQ